MLAAPSRAQRASLATASVRDAYLAASGGTRGTEELAPAPVTRQPIMTEPPDNGDGDDADPVTCPVCFDPLEDPADAAAGSRERDLSAKVWWCRGGCGVFGAVVEAQHDVSAVQGDVGTPGRRRGRELGGGFRSTLGSTRAARAPDVARVDRGSTLGRCAVHEPGGFELRQPARVPGRHRGAQGPEPVQRLRQEGHRKTGEGGTGATGTGGRLTASDGPGLKRRFFGGGSSRPIVPRVEARFTTSVLLPTRETRDGCTR